MTRHPSAPPKSSRNNGDTEAHYLPVAPRSPAPQGTQTDPPSSATTRVAPSPADGTSALMSAIPENPCGAAKRVVQTFDEEQPTLPELPLLQLPIQACPICRLGAQITDLPEIATWSCGHWIRKSPQPIAEAFQDMLRTAFQAGSETTTRGETFETWYQREVLR